MERHRQQFPKVITVEDWLAKAHPDAPGLPWKSDDGVEVCSFLLQPLTDTGGIQALLFDAHGRKVICSTAVGAILATCMALNAAPLELTFLPAPIKVKRPAN
jgi:hypothetical protein